MRFLAKFRHFINITLIPTGFQIERSKDYLPFRKNVDKKLLFVTMNQKQTNDFLLRFAQECDYLIDVGANRGSFAEHFCKINDSSKIVMIEPIPSLIADLQHKYHSNERISIHKYAISNSSGNASFHVTANDGQSSSLLSVGKRHLDAAPHAPEVELITVETRTLDQICSTLTFSKAFLKIDVQGNEMPALLGAKSMLMKTDAIHIEVSIQSLYEGDSIGFKVWEFLDGEGFVLYGIDPWFRDRLSNGELLQADFLFVKKDLLKTD